MDLNFIEQLVGLVENSRLVELEFMADGQRLRLSKSAPPAGAQALPLSAAHTAAPAVEKNAPATTIAQRPAPSAVPTQAAAQHRVTAGMGGTFFTRPSPDKAPFVQVGDLVQEGQVLAIIEAMKMLNSVEADVAGVIRQVCADEGEAIDAGAPLFTIETH